MNAGGAEVEGTLPYFIANAASGDDITFNFDGEIVELTMDVYSLRGKKLTINGLNQFNGKNVIIQSMSEGQGFFKLYVESEVPGELELMNLTFTGGTNTVVDARAGTIVTVKNCVFKDNNAGDNNGGVFRLQGQILIENSVFENNITNGTYGGGALCIYNAATVSVTGSTFFGNQSTRGGRAGGGAIVIRPTVDDPTNVVISNCTFANNSAAMYGGAVLASVQSSGNRPGNVGIVNSTFTGNQSTGGAVATLFNVAGTINMHLVNCLLAHNFNSDITAYDDVVLMNEEGSTATANVYFWNSIYGNVQEVPADNATIVTGFDASVQVDYDGALPSIFDAVVVDGILASGKVSTQAALPVVPLAENSIAIGAGRSTVPTPLAGMITIPTEDQLGQNRPSNPAVGSVEFDMALDIAENPWDNDEIQVWNEGNRIYLSGVNNATVEVYSLSGRRLAATKLSEGESFELNAPKGQVYIVNITAKGVSKAVKMAL